MSIRRNSAMVAIVVVAAVSVSFSTANASRELLVLVPDARSNALAGTGAADASDPGTVWLNPANAGLLSGIYASAYGGELYLNILETEYIGGYLSGGGRVYTRGGFAIAVGGELRQQQVSTVAGDASTRLARYTSARAGVDFRFSRFIHVSIGGAYGKYMQDVPAAEEEPYVYDVGVRVGVDTTWASGWRFDTGFAFSYRNEMEGGWPEFRLSPVIITGGFTMGAAGPSRVLFGTEVPALSFRVNIDWIDSDFNPEGLAFGTEVALWQVGFFRIGWADNLTAGLGLGAKVHHVRFRMDYAAVWSEETYFSPETYHNKLTLLAGWEW